MRNKNELNQMLMQEHVYKMSLCDRICLWWFHNTTPELEHDDNPNNKNTYCWWDYFCDSSLSSCIYCDFALLCECLASCMQ